MSIQHKCRPAKYLNDLLGSQRNRTTKKVATSIVAIGFGLIMLTGCPRSGTNSFIKRVQVAPNKAASCSSGLLKGCLLINEFDSKTQEFTGWITAVKDITNFKHEDGYLYDMNIRVSCDNGIGEGFPTVEFIGLNSKTLSTEIATGVDAAWPGFC